MTPSSSLTERYLDAALRGVPDKQRVDVARELRSSVADAVEDRVAAGEEPNAAEAAVLEGLGDPVRLAAGITGRPLWLIGPDLFVEYRQLLFLLLGVVVPIVSIVMAAVELSGGGDWVAAIVGGLVAGLNVSVHLCFWVTLTFVLIERVDSVREARDQVSGAAGRWTVDRLPAPAATRISAGEVVGEVLTALLTIGVLFLLASGLPWIIDGAGASVPLLNPDLWSFTMPLLIALLASIAGVQVVVYFVGRWTMPLAWSYAILQVAFAVPVIWLLLSGLLVNPAFADVIGWQPLADGTGPVMLAIAAGVLLVSAYEVFDAFRRARRAAALHVAA